MRAPWLQWRLTLLEESATAGDSNPKDQPATNTSLFWRPDCLKVCLNLGIEVVWTELKYRLKYKYLLNRYSS
jgi:hypothetical protein